MAGHQDDRPRDGGAGLQARARGDRPQRREAGPVCSSVRRVQPHEVQQRWSGRNEGKDPGGHPQRAPALHPPLLHRDPQGIGQDHREPGGLLQQRPERGGPRQVEGDRRGYDQGPGERGHTARRRASGPLMEVQEAVLQQDLQPYDRQALRCRHRGRRHRREGLRSRGRGFHVFHLPLQPQVQRRQEPHPAGCEGHRLHVRAGRRRVLEVPQCPSP